MSRLGDRLRAHARDRGDARAVFAGDRWWSYGQLVGAAAAVAAQLAARGIGAGDVVAIALDRGIEPVIALAAAALAGAIPAIVDPADADAAARTIAALAPALAVTEEDGGGGGGARITVDGDRAALDSGIAGPPPIRRAPGIAYVIFTSGSTAAQKGVMWSEARAGFDWMLAQPTPMQRIAPAGIVVPLCTSLGLHDLLHALFHALAVVTIDAPFRAALEQLRALEVNRLKLTPTHVELLLASAEALPRVRQVSVATAPLDLARLRALAERFPGAKVGRRYGLTEAGAGTAVWLHEHPGKATTVGRAIAHRRITVRDRDGNVLPPGTGGEVVIDLPMWDAAADGYLDPPPALARRFRNATLWTGDRGVLDGRGFLTLGPRQAEILKVGGRSVSAPRIEQVLGAAGGGPVAVVGVPDRVLGETACAFHAPTAGAAVAAAAAALREDERPRWFLPRASLPRNASGKLRRGLLAAEARRWIDAFPLAIVPEHRPFPAFALDDTLVVVDGDPWATAPPPPGTRPITLAHRSPPAPIATAYLAAGTAPLIAPDAPLPFTHALARLTSLLPG